MAFACDSVGAEAAAARPASAREPPPAEGWQDRAAELMRGLSERGARLADSIADVGERAAAAGEAATAIACGRAFDQVCVAVRRCVLVSLWLAAASEDDILSVFPRRREPRAAQPDDDDDDGDDSAPEGPPVVPGSEEEQEAFMRDDVRGLFDRPETFLDPPGGRDSLRRAVGQVARAIGVDPESLQFGKGVWWVGADPAAGREKKFDLRDWPRSPDGARAARPALTMEDNLAKVSQAATRAPPDP